MFVRALLVLLLVLNVGVAAWWILRAPPPVAATMPIPAGVSRLQLVEQAAPAPATRAAPPAIPQPGSATQPALGGSAAVVEASAAPSASAAGQCFSLGPFGSRQAALAARTRLQPLTRNVVVAERRGSGRGWRVLIPPLASADQADAIAQRIVGAGFDDYFVVRQGGEINSIALGRYGNEAAARRRAEALIAAGFAARAEPLGATTWWLDVAAAAALDPSSAQRLVGAPRRTSLDCAASQSAPAPPR